MSNTRQAKGLINIKWARLSRITNDDICAEDPEAVLETLKDNADLVDQLKSAKDELAGIWDLDSDYVTNVEVVSIKGDLIVEGHPALNNLEITFTCDLDEDASEDDVNSDLTAGLIPVIQASETQFVFSDYEDYSATVE